MVLVTGDLSDRIPELPDALALIADLKPRYGAFAAVGNHEYWRGIKDVRRAHDRSDVPTCCPARQQRQEHGADRGCRFHEPSPLASASRSAT